MIDANVPSLDVCLGYKHVCECVRMYACFEYLQERLVELSVPVINENTFFLQRFLLQHKRLLRNIVQSLGYTILHLQFTAAS